MWQEKRAASIAIAALVIVGGAAAPPRGQDKPTPNEPRVIEVVAKRYAFEPAKIEVTEGERVRLQVRSADGVHGLQIRRVGVNKLIPRGGKPVSIDFVAPAPGTYEILCSEECGEGHDEMTGTLVVSAKPKPNLKNGVGSNFHQPAISTQRR